VGVLLGQLVQRDRLPVKGRRGDHRLWPRPVHPDDGPLELQAEALEVHRHIVNICRDEGAWNITWFFHPNGESWPQTKWNEMAEYYPGDDYVDWIGVSVYGPQKPGESWTSFRKLMDEAYQKVDALPGDKPLALLEFGAAQEPHNEKKARWVRAALETLRSGRYPDIVAESYWHESWRNAHGPKSNLRLDSSRRTTRYYRREVRRSFYVTEPTFGPSL
jgi:Beta-mannanase